MRNRWLLGILGLVSIIALILLDTPAKMGYTALHQHMCFERITREPWETEPLGRIEQVGIKRVLVTMWGDRKPVAALDAKVYGFSMLTGEFTQEYKEVACLSQK